MVNMIKIKRLYKIGKFFSSENLVSELYFHIYNKESTNVKKIEL